MTNDDDLMAALRRAGAQADPVPPAVVRAGVGAFAWRNIDADLAELSFDSLEDQPELAVRSSAGSPRLVTFEASQLSVDLEVATEGDKLNLVGQLAPAAGARIQVRHSGGVAPATGDELGRFSVKGIDRGPVSLLVEYGGGAPVQTDWILL